MTNLKSTEMRKEEKRTDHDMGCATNAPPEDFGYLGCTCGFEKQTPSPTEQIKKIEKIIVDITCPDCSNGQDPLGCFDGSYSRSYFQNLEDAFIYAEDRTQDSIWEYKILSYPSLKEISKAKLNKCYKKLFGINYL